MKDIQKILRHISDDIVNLAREIMSSDIGINEKIGINTLYGSRLYENIKSGYKFDDDAAVFETFFNHYIEFIEEGRPPKHGKRPPVDVIVQWLKRKNIVSSNENIRSVAYAVSYAIWRDGYKARKVLAKLEEAVDKAFENDWADQLFNALIADIDDWFS